MGKVHALVKYIKMFTKEERKEVHTLFWKQFKSFGSKRQNAEGKRINWLNYPTRLKQIYIRLTCDNHHARFSIEIQDKDEGIRQLIWDQLEELKVVLESEMPEPGLWDKNAYNVAGQEIYRVYWHIDNVNMYRTEDQQKIFDFFMNHLIGFDKFFVEYRDVLFGLLK